LGGASKLKFSLSVGSTQGTQVLAAENLGEGLDRKEKVSAFGGNPALMLGCQGTAGDHTVNMDMVVEHLVPGMEHHGDAQLTAEPSGIASKGLQRLRSALEQEAVELARITLRQRVEPVWQSKDAVEIGYGQKLLLASLHPLDLSKRLALGTVAISARVVPHHLSATGITPRHVTPKQGSAAGFNVAHVAPLAS
jgi:hypothetical protein